MQQAVALRSGASISQPGVPDSAALTESLSMNWLSVAFRTLGQG